MNAKLLFSGVVVLSMVLMSFITVAADEKKTDGRAMATDDGLYWMDDTRLTNNPDTDNHPVLAVDTYGYSHVMWYRSGTHMYQKIDRYGNPAFNERRIATASLPVQHCGQPTERIGIDSQENFHIVWTVRGGMYGPMYQKFSSSGNPMCQPIDLAPMAYAPHVVSVAVGKNNKAYISYENEGSERIELAIIDQNFHLSSGYMSASSAEGATIGVDLKNNPHVVNRAWSTTGLFHTKFNHAGTVIVPNHKIPTPVGGSGWTTPMPYLAFGKDGAVHWLLASTTGKPKSLYYFKTDSRGNKLTNDILITSNAADYGDICVDSKLNVYIIWGDTADGDLHYVRIQSGKENATLRPVRLTKSPGESFAPQIAVDPDDSLHVVWVDNRDGNYEIYYKFAFSYGVELAMPPEEMAKIMFVHPNETKSANLTIRNLGGQNDTMHVNIDADFMEHEGGVGADYKGSGWKVWMDEDYSEIDMDAQEVLKFPIYVRGPYKGKPNDYIKVIISATSEMNPLKNDTVEFRVYLVVNHKIEVKCADSIHITSAGVPTTFIITVANIGDVDEIVNLTLSGPPISEWKYYLNEYEVWVAPRESKNVILTVTPPIDAPADSVGMVTVTGRCKAQPDVRDSAVTHTVVQPYMYVELTCDDPEHFVEPGNTTTYTIKVSNYGNVAGTVIIILEIVSGTGDWVATLDTNAVGVAGGETKEVLAMVTAPEDAIAGSRLVLRIEGSNAERTVKDDVMVTTIVKQVHKINVKVNVEIGKVDPGNKGIYTITIENKGNGDEEVMLGTSKLPVGGWDIVYKAADDSIISENDKLYLRPGSSLTFKAIIGVPLNALAGNYEIAGKLFDEKGNEYPINMELTVNQIYDVGLTTTLTKQIGGPGQRVLFTLIVKNKGNGDDTMKLSADGLGEGWNYEFMVNYEKIDEITLNATSVGKATLAIMIPKDASVKSVTFTVRAASLGDISKTSEIQLTVDVKMSDLEITKIDMYPSEPTPNKPSTVTVTIINTGDVIVENVTVAFYEDGVLVGREKLERVPGNSNKTATFNWLPKEGKHELKFIVDPDDVIKEKDEENNVKKQPVNVGGGGIEIIPGFETIMLMGAVFIGMLFIARRKRRF